MNFLPLNVACFATVETGLTNARRAMVKEGNRGKMSETGSKYEVRR